MINIIKPQASILQLVELVENVEEKKRYQMVIKSWNLSDWEDALLYQLFILDRKIDSQKIVDVGELLKVLRDESYIYTPLELKKINNLPVLLENEEFTRRFSSTLYHSIHRGLDSLGVLLRGKLDDLISGKAEYNDIDVSTYSYYQQCYTILCSYFFYLLPNTLKLYYFESNTLPLAVYMGFDVEVILKEVVESAPSFGVRADLCIELAEVILRNHTILGKDSDNNTVTVEYWINTFRFYSKEKFDSDDLLSFINDEKYLKNCSNEEKGVIKDLIQLYCRLINGYIMVPDGDMAELDKQIKIVENEKRQSVVFDIIKIQEIIVKEFKKDEEGQFEDLEGVLSRLQKLSIEYDNAKIAEAYYFDQDQGKFVWSDSI